MPWQAQLHASTSENEEFSAEYRVGLVNDEDNAFTHTHTPFTYCVGAQVFYKTYPSIYGHFFLFSSSLINFCSCFSYCSKAAVASKIDKSSRVLLSGLFYMFL